MLSMYYKEVDRAQKAFIPKGIVMAEADPTDFNVAHLGFSMCNPLDRFKKKMARDIATGRIKNTPIIVNLKDPTSIVSGLLDLPDSLQKTGIKLMKRLLKSVEKK